MGKTYKTKLNIKSARVREALKEMSGIYRKMFNVGMDIQFHRMTYSNRTESNLMSSTFVHKVIKAGEKELYPYISSVDSGITRRASGASNAAFRRWYNKRYTIGEESRLPVYKARKDGLGFSTTSKVKVFYDHISFPKLGDLKLYEKGYIPQGKIYKNVSFSYDGKDWWVSLEACEKSEVQELQGVLKVSSDLKGNVTLGDKTFSNIIESNSYKAQKAKRAKLVKKLKRQKESNVQYSSTGKRLIRTSRNMMKTRERIQRISAKMKEIKLNYFKKVAHEVARTKPRELQMLSLVDARLRHQGYLSRYLRESGTRDLLGIIKHRAEALGSEVTRYSGLVQVPRS